MFFPLRTYRSHKKVEIFQFSSLPLQAQSSSKYNIPNSRGQVDGREFEMNLHTLLISKLAKCLINGV